LFSVYQLTQSELVGTAKSKMNNTGELEEALLRTVYNLEELQQLKNVVLLIGIAGVGTSTITQFLAGNPQLIASKYVSDSSFFITNKNNKVIEPILNKSTPNLVPLSSDTDTMLVDCPGFSDTRSVHYDISAAVSTKNLLDQSKQVKIMLVTAHHSVRRGGELKGLTELLVHVVHFIKDFDKYKSSIGLVVTKVDNPTMEDDDGHLQYIEDSVLINQIGTFLAEVRVEIMKKPRSDFYSKQIQLLDFLTVKNDSNEFSKIGILRRPTKSGNLNSNKPLTKNRDAIYTIMNTVLNSSRVAPDDFGMSLSADSMILVSKMRETVNTRLSNILDEYIMVSQKSLNYAADNIESMKIAISRSITIAELLETELTPKMVISNLMDQIETLDPGHPVQQHADWVEQQKSLQFLESIVPTTKRTGDFYKYRMRVVNFKKHISDNVRFIGHNAEQTIDRSIGEVITQVMNEVKSVVVNLARSSQLPYSKLSGHIDDVYSTCEKFRAKNQNRPNLTFEEFLDGFKASFNISETQKEKLEYFQTNIEFIKGKVPTTITDGHQEKWMQGFSKSLNDIQRIADWFSFITDSYTKLIEYDNQNVIANTHRNLRNWTDFKVFSKVLGPNKALHSYLESRLTLSGKEQADLDNLIDAIDPSLDHSCESSKLIVEGNVIKLSEVKTNFIPKCPSFTELYIFASQTVFIDGSLTEPMKNVYIIAPTWSVKGRNRLIDLRGLDANPKGRTPAGEPGQPGGNFIGVGGKFVNEKELTVDVSGGKGGNGEDGANGQDGRDGLTPPTPRKTIWYKVQSHELLAPMLDSHDYCEHRIKYEEIAGFANEGGGRFKMFGMKGAPGSPGDNGGKPGYGAKPGIVLIDSNSNIKKLAFPGKNGAEGKGGQGGRGGEHGQTRSILCKTITHNTLFQFNYISESLENQGRADNGSNGASGVTGNSVEPAQPQSFVPLSTIAGQYKEYVQRKNSRFVDSLGFIDRHISGNRKRRSIATTPVVDNMNWTPQSLAIEPENFKTRSWPSEFSLSTFLTLADVLIRKVLKIKPITDESQADHTWRNHLLQAEMLGMVETCETKWKDQPQQEPFDSSYSKGSWDLRN
jgi:hypothetical protein